MDENTRREAELELQRSASEDDKAKIRELTEEFAKETEAYARMREQLQVYEAAERRKFAYAGTPGSADRRGSGIRDDDEAPATGELSARGPRPSLEPEVMS